MVARIEWSKLGGQPNFDTTVEAFFVKEYAHESGETYAVNGRGGDGGIDIHIRHGGTRIIAQLKFFPDGFSGNLRKTREGQIRDSFTTALTHDPDEWWLVVPSTLTPRERTYVLGLPSRHKPPLSRPLVRIVDAPELDILAAKHADLVTYFTREELLEAAKVFNQERALLIDQDDVVARVAALSARADTLDPDWRLDFFTKGDIVGTTLVAKHPLAAQHSPITINLNAVFSKAQDELRRRLERVLDYGVHDRIDLPSDIVTDFVIEGPPFVAGSEENVAISWIPIDSEAAGLPLVISFDDDKGRQTAAYAGKILWTGGAQRGVSVRAQFYETVTLEFLLPHDRTQGASMSVAIEIAGREPADIVRALTMLERFDEAHSCRLEIDGQQVAGLLGEDRGKSVLGLDRQEILAHKEIAEDLAYVQERTSQYFGYPEKLETSERVYLRCVRRLLEGRCIVLPEQDQVTVTFNGADTDQARELLGGTTMSIIIDQERFAVEVFGRKFWLGHCRVYAPQVHAVGAKGLTSFLASGGANGQPLTLCAEPGWGFWVFVVDDVITEADGRLRPTALEITGYPEAEDVSRSSDSFLGTAPAEVNKD